MHLVCMQLVQGWQHFLPPCQSAPSMALNFYLQRISRKINISHGTEVVVCTGAFTFSPFISNASLTKELFLNCSKEAFELKKVKNVKATAET